MITILSLLTVPGAAAHGTTGSDDRLVAHPVTTGIGFGVSEFTAPCSPGAATDGVDGDWWNITKFGDGNHHLGVTPALTLDIDVSFYSTECNYLDDGLACSQGFLGAVENCDIPVNAGFMIVNGYVGVGTYNFTVTDI